MCLPCPQWRIVLRKLRTTQGQCKHMRKLFSVGTFFCAVCMYKCHKTGSVKRKSNKSHSVFAKCESRVRKFCIVKCKINEHESCISQKFTLCNDNPKMVANHNEDNISIETSSCNWIDMVFDRLWHLLTTEMLRGLKKNSVLFIR